MKSYSCTKTSFKSYLQGKEYSTTTIASYERQAESFLEWTQKENVTKDQLRYQDVLAYMKYCSTKKGHSQRTVQFMILTLGHYFDYLQEMGEISSNPAKGIKVQGVKRRTLYHILEPHELHALYHNYQNETLVGKRHKVMLGLLIYQGLKSEELFRLEVKDVKLREGKVELPGGKKSNGRTLQMEPHQVMDIYEYVMKTRPEILEQSKERTERFFVGPEGGRHTQRFLDALLMKLRTLNEQVENADQLRASVIVKWLKQYNLREVQYLAGHRYISSTEAYQQNEMEGLSEEVNRFHPLG